MSAYASHLPVLRMVAGLLNPATVLELGSGEFSTPFFLSLPIRRLVSVEADEHWRGRLPADERLEVRSSSDDLNPEDFDLVLVDDGQNAEQRERTIRWVLGTNATPVVIHDADHYAEVIHHYRPGCAVLPTEPATAVAW